tara:strand:+ start:2042 stop:3091 length:1050 start_codon:yes stop_codon:yes gene_type:complete
MSIDDEWNDFIENPDSFQPCIIESTINDNIKLIAKCTDIYISTKTKIIYLNQAIDIYDVFWKIAIINYDDQKEGIIKKQIKISSTCKEYSQKLDEYLEGQQSVVNKIINFIDNPNGRIKFKDIRKISIGISKKDILYSRTKNKSAFYNCFVITLRIIYAGKFREFHIKVFNTGKLEIPGLQDDIMLQIIIDKVTILLKECTNENIYYNEHNIENILINSNFNCGFYIDREKLFTIMRHKYFINVCYDPCSYPGIQCVYYYDSENNLNMANNVNTKNIAKNILKVSYMIFRTGSILIVGKCSEEILNNVYIFVKKLLFDEYDEICIKNIENNTPVVKKCKQKKKIIFIKS